MRHQDHRRGVAGWSDHYYLWACRRACSAVSDRSWCMNMLHQLKNSKKMNKNEEIESLMIGNVPELIEAA
jgi:hypothetical protein